MRTVTIKIEDDAYEKLKAYLTAKHALKRCKGVQDEFSVMVIRAIESDWDEAHVKLQRGNGNND